MKLKEVIGMANEQDRDTLYKALWDSADALRDQMDASEYKNYLLGLIFYKFLSEKFVKGLDKLVGTSNTEQAEKYLDPKFKIKGKSTRNYIVHDLKNDLGYFIEPKDLFGNLIKQVEAHTFKLGNLAQALHNLEMSTKEQRSEHIFEGLFADVDLGSNHLGNSISEKNETISQVMLNLNQIGSLANYDGDVLGDAYEYLISKFASDAGKKAGEFYTPRQVSDILAQIVTYKRDSGANQIKSIYDPCMGSGSLLLTVGRHVQDPSQISYHGQEINSTTYNLARMNLMLHNVSYENMILNRGDTLNKDWPPASEPYLFDAVTMNPPYSWKWGGKNGHGDYSPKLASDPRFRDFQVPPKSRADYAFLLHGFYHLKNTGTMAIVLPHGVLFRGQLLTSSGKPSKSKHSEAKIRKDLILDNDIDAVIGLPPNIFHSTSIPTLVMVLKKNRTNHDIFFIDASHDYKKGKNQNSLTKQNIDKIVNTYKSRKDVKRYAHDASLKEIQDNDYNLNIPRYVDTFRPEPDIDAGEVENQISDVKQEIAETRQGFDDMGKKLIWTDKKDQNEHEK